MSNETASVKLTKETRDTANELKSDGETLKEFFHRVIKHIEGHPVMLDETFKPGKYTDPYAKLLTEITELRLDVAALREGLKIMVHAASKDNDEIKKIVNHFSKPKSV